MKISTILCLSILLAGCGTQLSDPAAKTPPVVAAKGDKVETTRDGTSTSTTLNDYKHDLAQRIVEVNSTKVYITQPQALLRSVIVIKYAVDANGNLLRSEIMRSNRDRETEATALSSLKKTAPFPKPAKHLLRRGAVELWETWLFNNDGRFQLRTVAQAQMGE